jgi:hypothetical protein
MPESNNKEQSYNATKEVNCFLLSFPVFFQKYSHLLEEKNTVRQLNHTELECIKDHSPMEGKT